MSPLVPDEQLGGRSRASAAAAAALGSLHRSSAAGLGLGLTGTRSGTAGAGRPRTQASSGSLLKPRHRAFDSDGSDSEESGSDSHGRGSSSDGNDASYGYGASGSLFEGKDEDHDGDADVEEDEESEAVAHLRRILCRVSVAAADSALHWTPAADEPFDPDHLLLRLPGAAALVPRPIPAPAGATETRSTGGRLQDEPAPASVGLKRRLASTGSGSASAASSSSGAASLNSPATPLNRVSERESHVPYLGSVMTPPSHRASSFVAQRASGVDSLSYLHAAGEEPAASDRHPQAARALAVDSDRAAAGCASARDPASAEPWKLHLPAPSPAGGGLWRRISSLPAWEREDRLLLAGPPSRSRRMFGCFGPHLEAAPRG